MNIIDLKFDLSNRYNIWSGLLGGLFLQLSYFGTDQSQVQRYISGQSVKESRLGLIFNGMVKIPMQFFILLTGVLVFVFYQFNQAPVNFNQVALETVRTTESAPQLESIEQEYQLLSERKKIETDKLVQQLRADDAAGIASSKQLLLSLEKEERYIRNKAKSLINSVNPEIETEDSDYIFISFVMNVLPIGIVGLLLAVIFSAAMSSTSAELNALASTTTVDIYKRNFKQNGSDSHYLKMSKLFTAAFGFVAILFALGASLFDNLIEAVNILGSLFYGTILGVFMAAFFVKRIKGSAVFIGALLAEVCVITIYILDRQEVLQIEYLWLNLIGCLLVVVFGWIVQLQMKKD